MFYSESFAMKNPKQIELIIITIIYGHIRPDILSGVTSSTFLDDNQRHNNEHNTIKTSIIVIIISFIPKKL